MKFRRVWQANKMVIQAKSKDSWISLNQVEGINDLVSSSDLIEILQLDSNNLRELQLKLDSLKEINNAAYEVIMPFEPASFRDFMLYEKHAVDATRGYVKKFLPKLFFVTQLIEKFTGKVFKRFRPHFLWYKQPIYYFGNHLNFVSSDSTIVWPSYSKALDYELEIGAVLAKPLYNATADEALKAIGGFVVLNDFSARDIQKDEMESGFGPQKAKHFISTMSSVVVTADEVLPYINDLNANIYINDVEIAKCHSGGMQFSFSEAIAFASKSEQLHPGEVFGSGTLPGGSGMENSAWLSRGDKITFHIDRIGVLTNVIEGSN